MAKEGLAVPLQWWVGPDLPPEHIWIDANKRPDGIVPLLRLQMRKWIVHPLKRHFAHQYAGWLQQQGCQVVAITGSAGKTTTKEMIYSVLSQGFKTRKTRLNIDPVYNIPQTLLNTPLDTQRLVVEMGIEYKGEMDFYTWLVQPDIAVVTALSLAHTEFLEDLEGVKREKGKMLSALRPSGTAILNRDDPEAVDMARKTKANIVWFGTKKGADVKGENLKINANLQTEFTLVTSEGKIDISLPFLGYHFVSLALAAATVGVVNGLTLTKIKQGLETTEVYPHRMVPTQVGEKIIVDDTYNSNPLASIEAIRTILAIRSAGRKILVLGEMKELGDYEEKGHREVGQFAATQGVDYILAVGPATQFLLNAAVQAGLAASHSLHFENKTDLLRKLKIVLKSGDIVLVKGSRSTQMEEVVAALTQ